MMTQENPVQKKSNMKVIALAVVCIILAASLIGVVAFYHAKRKFRPAGTNNTERHHN